MARLAGQKPVADVATQYFTGTLTDAQTGLPVSSASVYFKSTAQTVLSDTAGFFYQKIRSAEEDSITITSVGYQPEQLAISTTDKKNIKLKPIKSFLQNVTVQNSGGEVLNNFKRGTNSSYLFHDPIFERGNLFMVNATNRKLTGIKIAKDGKKSMFRVKVYAHNDSDSIRQVKPLLYSQLVETGDKIVYIDLSSDPVKIPGDGFIVTIQCIDTPMNRFTMKTRIEKQTAIRKYLLPELDLNTKVPTTDRYSGASLYRDVWLTKVKLTCRIAATLKP